jgi:hypothetical protein
MSTDIIENLFVQLLDSGSRVITKKSTPSQPPQSVKTSALASFVKIKAPYMWSVLTFDRVNVENTSSNRDFDGGRTVL